MVRCKEALEKLWKMEMVLIVLEIRGLSRGKVLGWVIRCSSGAWIVSRRISFGLIGETVVFRPLKISAAASDDI